MHDRVRGGCGGFEEERLQEEGVGEGRSFFYFFPICR